MRARSSNLDPKVVEGFGDEWSRFDQSKLDESESTELADAYFSLVPWSLLGDATGFDLGCGSGRWALRAAPRLRHLHCIDPSAAALDVARRALQSEKNVSFHLASVDAIPLPDASQDFGYSLGVLHHVPHTADGMRSAVAKLKPGAPFLVYLYYALDNRPFWFRALWRTTDLARRVISRAPQRVRFTISDVIAALVYFPLARATRLLELLGLDVEGFPLAVYRRRSFYVMRTDALDRFGTRLEQRFTRVEIQKMMEAAGLDSITFREEPPYWCALGFRRPDAPA